jgi:membrane-bound inhibitor of C-type lysozyme
VWSRRRRETAYVRAAAAFRGLGFREFVVRRSLAIAALMLLTLSACATVAPTRTPVAPSGAASGAPSARATPSEDPAQAITAPVTYACKAGKRFTATYPAKGDRAIVAAGGLTKALPLAPSGSGVRYAKDGFEIWGKGDAAMLSGFPGGPYAACQAR